MSQQLVNDVSPWPQADRANPTRGELAEDTTNTVSQALSSQDSIPARMPQAGVIQ